jgi:hypothetical protein
MRRLIFLVVLIVSLNACAGGKHLSPRPKLPYSTWYIGLVAPKHMEVWVESINVTDRRRLTFSNVFGGVAGHTGKVRGWHEGTGKIMPINNVDLPDHVYLRWQSLAEPQTYMIDIEIPPWVRDVMLKQEHIFCKFMAQKMKVYRDTITLGMAPGGIVKVWVGDGCLGYLEVGRFQAKIDPHGPYRGLSKGNYIKMEPENKEYVEKHGIPYGSW